MRTCIIANPQGGTLARQPELLDRIRAVYGADVWLTQQQRDGTTLARSAVEQGYDRVVAAGGDGTINEVLNGIAPHSDHVQFGVLPIGTANDFARSLDLPEDLETALAALDAGVTRQIDLMEITTDRTSYCINVSAGGFSGMFQETASHADAPTWRPLVYLRTAVEMVSHLDPYQVTVTFDEETPSVVSLCNLVVANGCYVAHGVPIAPQAQLDDGWMDVVLIRATSLPQLAVLVPQVLLGQHLASDQVIFRRARRVAVQSDPPMWLSVEGEVLGKTPVVYRILPGALRIIVR